ncbi:hypothetical protein AC1031_000445 [Aphanomyces cochlioides]|nr:hypothetical protein AC1031_000445 [Aphanomyces cochlioides]
MRPDPHSRFSLGPLHPSQKTRVRRLGETLLNQALVECETSLHRLEQHWKFVRNYHGLKIYKAKSKHAPSEIMATGVFPASVSDIMQCLYADNTLDMRMHSALLMPKEHLDCEVLYPLDVQDETHPFRFNGLKWGAMQWPNKGGKSRDMCYFESTGMAVATDEFGREHDYGYCFMESFELPQCPQLDAFSIVRAKVSIRHIFRELPLGGSVVMTHATMDPKGPIVPWVGAHATIPPQVLAMANMTECAQALRLSAKLRLQFAGALVPITRGPSWRKLSFLLNQRHSCALCLREESTLERHRVVEVDGIGVKTSWKHFCQKCLAASVAQYGPSLDVSQSSLCMSGYESSNSSPATTPGAAFDFEDVDEVHHPGLTFSKSDLSRRDQIFLSETESSFDSSSPSPRENDDCCHLHRTNSSVAMQLIRLTKKMDNVWGMVCQNKTQADYIKSSPSTRWTCACRACVLLASL